MPYLIHDFHLATTIALIVVSVELVASAWIRKRFIMDMPLLPGSVLVFLAGWLIGAG